MSDKGKPHNVGQAIFESFGKGLQALSGILETDRQNKLQDLQLQMNMQVQEARLESLRVSTAKNQEALNLMNETPEETTARKQQEAQNEALAQLEFQETILGGFVGDPMSGILESAEAAGVTPDLAELSQIVEQQSGLVSEFKFGALTLERPQIDEIGGGLPLSAKDKIIWEALGKDPVEFANYQAGIGKYARGAKEDLSVDEVLKIIEGVHPLALRPDITPPKVTLKSLKRQALVDVYGEVAVRNAEETYKGDEKTGAGAFSTAPFEDQERLLKALQ